MSDFLTKLQNEGAQFAIATKSSAKDPWTITGLMRNEIAIAGSNDFQTARDVLGETIAGKVLDIKDKFGSVFKLSGRSAMTDFESTKVWNGSGIPQFAIEVAFINNRQLSSTEVGSCLYKMKKLQSTVLPSMGSPATLGRKGHFYRAPLGYQLDGSGTLILKIGKWFRAVDLVATSVNLVPSKEVMMNGSPLYVSGSITLEPMKPITYEEFQSWFRN